MPPPGVLAFCSIPESLCASLTLYPSRDVTMTVLQTSRCNLYSAENGSLAGSQGKAEDASSSRNTRKGGCFSGGKVLDLSVCRSSLFWGVLCAQATGFLTGALAPAFLPPLAKEKGLTDKEATHLLTVMGGLDVISRLLPGVIAHYQLMKPHVMVIITLFVLGLSCQFVRYLDTFAGMMAFCALFGLLAGVFFSMTPAVVIHYLGLSRFATTFGFIQLFNGVASAVTYPLLGALKDRTGTYAASYHYLGATSLFSAILLASLPLWGRVQKVQDDRKDEDTDEQQAALQESNGLDGDLQQNGDLEAELQRPLTATRTEGRE